MEIISVHLEETGFVSFQRPVEGPNEKKDFIAFAY
jgi:hypothetical protein